MNEVVAIIRPERQKAVERRHPWVFSGAIARLEGQPTEGGLVTLRTQSGQFLARGYWNSHSDIRIHILTWDEGEAADESFWRRLLERAIQGRELENRIYRHGTANAYRLVNAENDALPGLVVDRYGDWLVMQALTLGIAVRKEMLADILMNLLNPAGIYERSDADVRQKEGLPPETGSIKGKEPPDLIEIDENGRRFLVDVRHGHKTGFYLDQRENRAIVGDWFRWDEQASERVALNCFSYTGGFAVYALGSLAKRVINIDSSADALNLARRNIALNGFPHTDDDFVMGDVFQVLRYYRDTGMKFDMIILDPPKFAQSPRQVEGAARGYKDINLLAFRLLKPGGALVTFSCSGAIDEDLFQKIVFGALVDAGREAQIIRRLGQAPDHPVALTFPEGAYLKGLLCRVLVTLFFLQDSQPDNFIAGFTPANPAESHFLAQAVQVHAPLIIAHGTQPAQRLKGNSSLDSRSGCGIMQNIFQIARCAVEQRIGRAILFQVFVQNAQPIGIERDIPLLIDAVRLTIADYQHWS